MSVVVAPRTLDYSATRSDGLVIELDDAALPYDRTVCPDCYGEKGDRCPICRGKPVCPGCRGYRTLSVQTSTHIRTRACPWCSEADQLEDGDKGGRGPVQGQLVPGKRDAAIADYRAHLRQRQPDPPAPPAEQSTGVDYDPYGDGAPFD